VLIADFEHVVDDLDGVIGCAQDAYPGLPTVLVGHSLGGLIATRSARPTPPTRSSGTARGSP
jgi:alpha-beta hydrolase superfamily lysophospholipase